MLTPKDYADLFVSCMVSPEEKKQRELDFICETAISNQSLYQAVSKGTLDAYGIEIPWPLIAVIHYRESNQNFNCHLHNGDPLSEKTIHVPEGRPADLDPPFTWVESAIDAFDDIWIPPSWDLPGCLEFLERYNGVGYQKRSVFTPYIWSYTDKYQKGLFIMDGCFDPEKVDARPGCAAILKYLSLKGVSLVFTGMDSKGRALH